MPQKPPRPNPPPPKCVDGYGSPCRGCPEHPRGVNPRASVSVFKRIFVVLVVLLAASPALGVIYFYLVHQDRNPPEPTISCPDNIHRCPINYVCTPDSKQCTNAVNKCADNEKWCMGSLICTPDSKSCVTRVNYCRDLSHWCTNRQFCSNDNTRCIEEDQSDPPVFIFIPN